jgi:hypothetical protein
MLLSLLQKLNPILRRGDAEKLTEEVVEMADIKVEIIEMTETYLTFSGEWAKYTADIGASAVEDFLGLLIDTLISDYKLKRAYPSSWTEDMISADVERYFSMKKTVIASQIIPAMIGKVGGEGLTHLLDTEINRSWSSLPYLNDVLPICGVV